MEDTIEQALEQPERRAAGLRARSLGGLFPRIEAQRARIDRHLTPAGRWLAGAGLVAALFGLDIGRTLCWQFAALALAWLLLALLLARLRRMPLTITRPSRVELRAGTATTLPVAVTSQAQHTMHGLSLVEAPGGHALPGDGFVRLHRRLAGTPPRWVSAELAWTCFRHALSRARGHDSLAHDMAPLEPGAAHALALPFTALRRGEIHLPGLFLLAAEPLGLARGVRRIAAPMDILALPALLPVARWRLAAPAAGGAMAARQSRASAEEEFRALRLYRPGDARRRIHWRVSARRGELVVRETSGGETERAQVALACVAAPDAEAAFEAAVQVAAACLEQRPPAPVRPTLLLAGGRGLQVIEAASARGVEAQLRALARCSTDAVTPAVGPKSAPGHATPVGLQRDAAMDTGTVIEALAARLAPGIGAEWAIALPLAAHRLHRLERITQLHAGLTLYLVGETAPDGPRPPRARWMRPSRLADDWQAGGAVWP